MQKKNFIGKTVSSIHKANRKRHFRRDLKKGWDVTKNSLGEMLLDEFKYVVSARFHEFVQDRFINPPVAAAIAEEGDDEE